MPTVPIGQQGIHQTRHFSCSLAIPAALVSIMICGCPSGIPPELIEPGVKKGEDLYEKRLLIDLEEVLFPCEGTFVEDVRRVNTMDDSDVIAVLTDCGVIHYDLKSGAVTSQKALNPFCDPLKFVDIESDGSLGVFCNRWSLNGFGLLDAEGEIVWLRNEETPGQVSNFKDLDGDGSLDFCARFEQALACFNLATGEELWREAGTRYVEVSWFVDFGPWIIEDETTYVLAPICSVPHDVFACDPDSGSQLEIRNGHGTLIDRIALFCDEAIDELCHFTRKRRQDGGVQLIHGPPLRFVDADNSLLTEPQTPPSAWQWRVGDVAVLPSLDARAQIGVIWGLGVRLVLPWNRYLFRIHDGGGDVVYEEVFSFSWLRFWTLDEEGSPGESQPFFLSARELTFAARAASELYLYQPTAPGDRNSLIFK